MVSLHVGQLKLHVEFLENNKFSNANQRAKCNKSTQRESPHTGGFKFFKSGVSVPCQFELQIQSCIIIYIKGKRVKHNNNKNNKKSVYV